MEYCWNTGKNHMVIIGIAFLLLLISLSLPLVSQEADKYELYVHPDYDFPYRVNNPDVSWDLPGKLKEVSGLSYIDDDLLACVQDEKGNIYIFNLKSGEVERKIDFEDDGDYEGIEVVDRDAWVLKSNGTLFEVRDFLKEETLSVKKYATELTGKNDAEGLGFDPIKNNLLIACKGHPYVDDKKGKEFKAIYNFSLDQKKLDMDPLFLIVMDSVKYYKNYNTMTQLGVELMAFINDSKGDVSFQPSGMAVHPVSGNLYIIASVGNLLIVYSRESEMLAMFKLRNKYFPQPEGICFSPDGTLYISNEADDNDEATILKFGIKK
jgi:uncharacterized protein YjiK